LSKSTKSGIKWELKYKIELISRSEAMLLEIFIKKRGAKRYLEDLNAY
jgi:putative endonuclease